MKDRTAARVAGVLFLSATLPFSFSVYLLAPVIGVPDYLIEISRGVPRVSVGALLELINHIAVVGIAVVLYPVLRRVSERLALAYVAARSIEAVLFVIGTMHLLALVGVSQEFMAAGAPADSHFQTLGEILLAGHDTNNATFAFTAFSIGALILNYLLYKSRLIPRWISVWGMIGAALILGVRLMLISGIEPSPSVVTLMDTPIMLQELVFAVWLIVKGFHDAASPSGLDTP